MHPKLILSPLQVVLPVDYEEVDKEVKLYLNVQVKPCLVDGIYGYATKGIMYLAQECPPGIWYHELFHLIIEVMNPSTKAKLLDASREWLGYSKEREKVLGTFYIQNGYRLSESLLIKLVLEEQLADAFEDFMNFYKSTELYVKNYPSVIYAMKDAPEDSIVWSCFWKTVDGQFAHLPIAEAN